MTDLVSLHQNKYLEKLTERQQLYIYQIEIEKSNLTKKLQNLKWNINRLELNNSVPVGTTAYLFDDLSDILSTIKIR